MAAFLPQYGHIGPAVMVTFGSQLACLEEKSNQHTLAGVSTMQSGRLGSLLFHPSNTSALSSVYSRQATINCFPLFMQWTPCALHLARDSAGSNMAARMAMMAITTSNSIRVNPVTRASPAGNRWWFMAGVFAIFRL